MRITDKVLDDYQDLHRHKNTWGFVFNVNGLKTKFQLAKKIDKYLVYIHQNYIQTGIYQETILLGVVVDTDDLEDLFSSITRGEQL